MIWAAIETSTTSQTLALSRDGRVVAVREPPGGAQHGRVLASAWRELLDEGGVGHGDIAQIVVGAGPGSFTGLRIGLAFARGVSLATGARVALVSSLQPLAEQVPVSLPACVALDARRGEVYALLVGAGPARTPTSEVAAWRPAELASHLAGLGVDLGLVGGGFAAYPEAFEALLGSAAYRAPSACPHARALLEFAHRAGAEGVDRGALEPVYVRGADADAPRVAPMDAETRRAVLGDG